MITDNVGMGIKIRSRLHNLLNILRKITLKLRMPSVDKNILLLLMKTDKYIHSDMAEKTEECL
jgi:hypothetical protein